MSGIVKHSDTVSNTPAFAIIAEGFAEITYQNRVASGSALVPYSDSSECFYTLDPVHGDITGVLVFNFALGYATVELAYVEETSRRQGLFVKMLEHLKTLSATRGSGVISFPTRGRADLEEALGYAGWRRAPACHGMYEVRHGC